MKYLLIFLISLSFFSFPDDQELLDQIGQMIIIGFRESELSPELNNMIKEVKPGGFILFDQDIITGRKRNIINLEQTKKLINDLDQLSETPAFISIDLEGGKINRLNEFFSFPSHAELGKRDNIRETKKVSQNISKELEKLGFNLNFAPVVDVNTNTDNPIIGKLDRSFSSNPEKVFNYALAFVQGLEKNNIIPVIKHFPGHGSSGQDSHLQLVDITATWQEKEFIPFAKMIEQDFSGMIMMGHLINQKIDNKPASLSSAYVKKLRNMGFSGVIITDDLQMIDYYSFEQAVIKAVQAGNDILLIGNNLVYDPEAAYKTRDIIFQAVKEGKISRKSINESYKRILELKNGLQKSSYKLK